MTIPRVIARALSTVVAIALAFVLVGCGVSLQSLRDGASGSAPASAAPVMAQPPTWPTISRVDLPVATYLSSPPFELAFTLAVGETGWESGDLHTEFFDLVRFDSLPETDLPAVLLGFAVPTMIRGAGGNEPAATLTPDAAIDGLAARADLSATKRGTAELFGRAGARVDLRAEIINTQLFGGPNGNFGLGPERDVRIVAIAIDGGLLLVLVMAPPGEVEEAWTRVQPILESIVLPGE